MCTMSSKGHSLSKLYVILPRALSNPTQPYRRCNGTACNHIHHRHHWSKRSSQECKTTLCNCHLESKLMSDAMSRHCSQKAIKHGMRFQNTIAAPAFLRNIPTCPCHWLFAKRFGKILCHMLTVVCCLHALRRQGGMLKIDKPCIQTQAGDCVTWDETRSGATAMSSKMAWH